MQSISGLSSDILPCECSALIFMSLWIPNIVIFIVLTLHLPFLQWSIFVYYFLLCVCMRVCASRSIQKSEDSLWVVTVSFSHVHPEGHSQELLCTELLTGLSTSLYVYWLFGFSRENYVLPLDSDYVLLSGHWVLKEAMVFINRVSKRNCCGECQVMARKLKYVLWGSWDCWRVWFVIGRGAIEILIKKRCYMISRWLELSSDEKY